MINKTREVLCLKLDANEAFELAQLAISATSPFNLKMGYSPVPNVPITFELRYIENGLTNFHIFLHGSTKPYEK